MGISDKKNLIKKINREYQSDIENSESREVTNLVDTVNDILNFLKGDLYTEEYHFILELIQNAEDNNYNVEKPKISFILETDRLIVKNNEVGFSEDDIKAISNAGPESSTKKNMVGYIGHKGIGFKSVFNISNTPEIHSNGYHFYFNKNEPLGIINPHWKVDYDYLDEEDLGKTVFIFPFRDYEEIYTKLKIELEKFDPELLLFLNTLKIIEIEMEGNGLRIEKVVKGDIAEIQSNSHVLRRLIIKKTMDVPNEIKKKSIQGNIKTEIIFAFPVDKDDNLITLDKSNIFAYFPLRSYGFNFIIQSDFHTTANREALPEFKERNRWLINQMPEIFLQAIGFFKENKNFKFQFYKYIPSMEIIEKPFDIFIDRLLELLKTNEFVLTENEKWCTISKVKMISEHLRTLFPKEDFQSIFNVDYEFIHPKLMKDHGKKFFRNLGIQDFSPEDLLHLLHNYEWLNIQDDKWFVSLYSLIWKSYQNELNNDTYLNDFKELKIFRNRHSLELVSLKQETIYYNIKYKGYSFESYFNILPELFGDIVKQDQEINDLFLKLEIFQLKKKEIQNFILNFYASESWEEAEEEIRIDTILFLKNFPPSQDDFDDYFKCIKFRVSSGEYIEPFLNQGSIFLHQDYSKYDNLYGVLDISIPVEIYYIDQVYLEKEEKSDDTEEVKENLKENWRSFFRNFLISDNFVILEIPHEAEDCKPAEEIKHTAIKRKFKKEEREKIRTTRYSVHDIYDFEIKYLKEIVKTIEENSDFERAVKLLITINRLFSEKLEFSPRYSWRTIDTYSKYHYGYFNRDRTYQRVNDAKWIRILIKHKIYPTTNKELEYSQNIFLYNEEIFNLVGKDKHLPIISQELDLNKTFIKILGIHDSLSPETIIKILERKKSQNIGDQEEYVLIYKYLLDHTQSYRIIALRDVFIKKDLIFIKDKGFFSSSVLIWEDIRKVVDEQSQYQPLKEVYPNLGEFFLNRLNVSESYNEYFCYNRLEEISQNDNKDITDDMRNICFKLYEIINYNLETDKFSNIIFSDLSYIVKSGDILQTINNEKDIIYINDNSEIFEAFKMNNNIFFLEIPENSYYKLTYFIDDAEFSYISKEVDILLKKSENRKFSDKWTFSVQNLLPCIQNFLYFQNRHYYTSCEDNNIFQIYEHIRCAFLDNLTVIYELTKGEDVYKSENKAFSYFDQKANTIYIDSSLIGDISNLKLNIALKINEFFKRERLVDFILLFLKLNLKQRIEYFKNAGWPIIFEILDTGSEEEEEEEDDNGNGGVDVKHLKKIGIQGEENALNYLKKIKSSEYDVEHNENITIVDKEDGFLIQEEGFTIFDATWENMPLIHGEQRKGYDLSFSENGIKNYIEVKSTVTPNIEWFKITKNEWKYFINEAEKYYIYRVYNVELGKKFNDDID
ncbi:hypothetical protein LCGC14_1283230, partial [marine sediment metagenome]